MSSIEYLVPYNSVHISIVVSWYRVLLSDLFCVCGYVLLVIAIPCSDLPSLLTMNQQCKVCGEPAAGFHFGAFTCEGCKSFFGRSYNNLSSISECKNGGQCVINKKNRTSCKACRLRKCLVVGMSKSGSRYGRRSNWFKIHCLLQEQANNNNNNNNTSPNSMYESSKSPQLASPNTARLMQQQFASLSRPMKSLDDSDRDYKTSSPSISSPESDCSVEISDARLGILNGHLSALRQQKSVDPKDFFMPLPFLPPGLMQSSPFAAAAAAAMAAQHKFLFPTPSPYLGLYPPAPPTMKPAESEEMICSKRFYLDAILHSQRAAMKMEPEKSQRIPTPPPVDQDNPMDLSMKSRTSPMMDSDEDSMDSMDKSSIKHESDEEKIDFVPVETANSIIKPKTTPLDLTTRLEA
ncbi:hypothetical protein B566_EDAN004866 [Ephemera danica]|nr:hypothetical protein B566_EDAN004866 [Ephemera danica]